MKQAFLNPREDSYILQDQFIDSEPYYYGYANASGAWFIMRWQSNSMRFVKGSSDYATNWTNRASLSYDYYFDIF
jgi:hypothetical protein